MELSEFDNRVQTNQRHLLQTNAEAAAINAQHVSNAIKKEMHPAALAI